MPRFSYVRSLTFSSAWNVCLATAQSKHRCLRNARRLNTGFFAEKFNTRTAQTSASSSLKADSFSCKSKEEKSSWVILWRSAVLKLCGMLNPHFARKVLSEEKQGGNAQREKMDEKYFLPYLVMFPSINVRLDKCCRLFRIIKSELKRWEWHRFSPWIPLHF